MAEKLMILDVNRDRSFTPSNDPHSAELAAFIDRQRDASLAAFVNEQREDNNVGTVAIFGAYPLTNIRERLNHTTRRKPEITTHLGYSHVHHTDIDKNDPKKGGIIIATNHSVIKSEVPVLGVREEEQRRALVLRLKLSTGTLQIAGIDPPDTDAHAQFSQVSQLEDTYLYPRPADGPPTILIGRFDALSPDSEYDAIGQKIASSVGRAAAYLTGPLRDLEGPVGEFAKTLGVRNRRALATRMTGDGGFGYKKLRPDTILPFKNSEQVYVRHGLRSSLRVTKVSTVATPDNVHAQKAIVLDYAVSPQVVHAK